MPPLIAFIASAESFEIAALAEIVASSEKDAIGAYVVTAATPIATEVSAAFRV
jgi:hypothetical protein